MITLSEYVLESKDAERLIDRLVKILEPYSYNATKEEEVKLTSIFKITGLNVPSTDGIVGAVDPVIKRLDKIDKHGVSMTFYLYDHPRNGQSGLPENYVIISFENLEFKNYFIKQYFK